MAQHIVAKHLSALERSASDIGEQLTAAFEEMEAAITSGSRTAQRKALAAIRGLTETAASLASSAHDHAKALMPEFASDASKGEAQSAEDIAATKAKARVTRTSVPQGE